MLIIRVTLYLVVILLVADVVVIGLLAALIKRNVVVKYSIWRNSTKVVDDITAEIGDVKLSLNFDTIEELLPSVNKTGVLFQYPDDEPTSISTTPPTFTLSEPDPTSSSTAPTTWTQSVQDLTMSSTTSTTLTPSGIVPTSSSTNLTTLIESGSDTNSPSTAPTLSEPDPTSPSTTPLTLTPSEPESDQSRPYEDHRLPAQVIPTAYELYLRVNLTTNSFGGKCAIDVKVTAATSFFIVHAGSYLNVTETQVWTLGSDGKNGEVVPLRSTFTYDENEFWVVELTSAVDPGLYRLQMDYKGAFVGNDELSGLYKGEYVNKATGKKSAFMANSFEPTDARKAFPCFDEPNLKSTFDVTILHDKEYVALSNMPAVDQKSVHGDLKETKFMKSEPMSTYLVTFILCDLKWKSTSTKDGKTLRVYATPDQIKNAEYALNAGQIAYDYYLDYFGVPYPLPKLDLVAVPDYGGAMENWGAISFSEYYMLFDPKESGVRSAYDVVTVVSHEIAHQWFGDIVTMNWWDDLWLNEGFANYMEYLSSGIVEPTWNLEEDTVVTDLQLVMDLDSGLGSHPIVQTVNHPSEINELFDDITYSKGCSVIRMLSSFLGMEDFRKGLKSYLTKHSFANAKSSDLWYELSEASSQKLDVAAIMATWTEQMGFPLITIKRSKTDSTKFTAEQERFFTRPGAEKLANRSESKFKYIWQVPLTYRQLDGSNAIIWLDGPKKSFQLPWALDREIKFNVDQTGYYKVNYEVETWKEVALQLQDDHQYFSRLDRVNLLDDAMTLAKAGYLDYSIALNVTRYLIKETDYMPWYAMEKNLMAISNLLQNTDLYQYFREYVLQLVSPLYSSLGWKDEGSYLEKNLRALILDISCSHGNKACLTQAQDHIKMRIDGKYVGPNLRDVVYKYGIASSSGADEWNAIWKRYTESTTASEKDSLLRGLTFSKQPWLINRVLRYIKNETLIASQDVGRVFCYASNNPSARGIVWDFYRSEYEYMVNRYSLESSLIGRLLVCTTKWFAEEFRLQEMQDFFSKYPEAGGATRARQQAVENVRTNIDWLKRQKGSLKRWLQTL